MPGNRPDATVPAHAPRITHAFNTFLKGLFLFAGTIFALFAAYMLWWRTNFCTMMMQWNAAVPPQDLDNYMMRRLAHREICGFGDYALEIFGLMLAMFIAGIAWHTLTSPKAGESGQPIEPL